jgi:hypothetical protein
MKVYKLGGCGKSALAIDFAYCALATDSTLVLWVSAASQEGFELAQREILLFTGCRRLAVDPRQR